MNEKSGSRKSLRKEIDYFRAKTTGVISISKNTLTNISTKFQDCNNVNIFILDATYIFVTIHFFRTFPIS